MKNLSKAINIILLQIFKPIEPKRKINQINQFTGR
jgi:hypothetical protein